MTEFEIKRLCERVKELWKEKEQLKDQIADIKANCDLAIEGRDIKIKELEDHLAEEVELHLHAEEYIKSLEQQIEKMKSCENCRWLWLKKNNETVTACSSCKDKNMWRLKK